MFKLIISKTLIVTLVLNLATLGIPRLVYAELIGTQTLIQAQEREHRLAQIDEMLARAEVRDQFVAMGVDPLDARMRVAALSDSELQHLAQQLDELPAGGSALAIVGAVFVVLLVLELVGVTNIFTRL